MEFSEIKRNKDEKIKLNIGGSIFQCLTKTLQTFPDSRLAKLNQNAEEYDDINEEYFFDRNPLMFGFILDAYRSGTVHLPRYLCGSNFKDELDFWEIYSSCVAPCCWKTLYKAESYVQIIEILSENYKVNRNVCLLIEEERTFREKLWLLLDEPKSSIYAKIWCIFMSCVIILSTLVTVLYTVKDIRSDTYTMARKQAIKTIIDIGGWRIPTNDTSTGVSIFLLEAPAFLFYIDVTCFVVFTLEIIANIIACPNRRRNIFTCWLHMSDIICSLSFWITVGFEMHIDDMKSVRAFQAYIILRFFTLLKLVRLFRIIKHISAFNIMGLTFQSSGPELKVVGLILCLLTTVFGTIMYTCEFLNNDEFENIFSAMYWALITLTTVGYGDYVPFTVLGHLTASACALCGVLVMALPIGVIASSFGSLYSHHQYASKHMQKHKETMVGVCEMKK